MKIVDEVMKEVEKATAKFPTWPTDPLHALAVLGEEYGELTKSVLQFTYEPHKSTLKDIRTEAIQTAAMSLRFLMSLHEYDYKKAEQHKQTTENQPPVKCHHAGCGQPYVGGPCALCYE